MLPNSWNSTEILKKTSYRLEDEHKFVKSNPISLDMSTWKPESEL